MIGFKIVSNNKDVIPQITCWGDDNTAYNVNNLSFSDIVAQGSELAPGDVALLPSGATTDTAGIPNPVYPWIARFKNDVVADIFTIADRRFCLMYTPAIPPPYKRISVAIKNTSSSIATLPIFVVDRILYEPIAGEYDNPRAPLPR